MNELNLSNFYSSQTMNDWYDWRDYGWSNVQFLSTDTTTTINDEIKDLKHRMSEMQTEINNIRAENQMLRNSLKTYIKEMKEIINKKK